MFAVPMGLRTSTLRRSIAMTLGLFGVALLSGCGDDEAAACEDLDGDGYGTGCEAGDDCDDENASRNVDCEAVPPPDCTADPLATGCPCLAGATTGCYPGPEGTAGVGMCVSGRASCLNGFWGLCDGAIVPRPERCNDVDDDCDGIVDDGVLSPCGACTPGCDGAVWGEADRPFEVGPGLGLGPLDDLMLAFSTLPGSGTVWVANSGEGTLSKIDATEAREIARYATGGTEPSRVVVDYRGDAWVANREFDGVSSLLKIAGEPARCQDGDGDGLETSSGPADVLPFGTDECVLMRVEIGEPAGVARALAVDGDRGPDGGSGGNLWVGLHDGQEVYAIDGETGNVRDRLAIPGFRPYAAAFDPWGTLWLADRDGLLARVDRGSTPLSAEIVEVPRACFLLYSLVADSKGTLFATGFSCDQVLRYEPALDRWTSVASEASPRGITWFEDRVFASHTGGLLSVFDAVNFELQETLDLAGGGETPIESIGVSVDVRGEVWVASGQREGAPLGLATRVNPGDGAVVHVPVGDSPHTQGDLTGGQLLGSFAEEGETTEVFEGCPGTEPTDWKRVHLSAQLGPQGTVEVAVRHASDEAALSAEPFVVLGRLPADSAPFDLDLPTGGVLEVRLRLATQARDGSPRVRRVGVEWVCPGPD